MYGKCLCSTIGKSTLNDFETDLWGNSKAAAETKAAAEAKEKADAVAKAAADAKAKAAKAAAEMAVAEKAAADAKVVILSNMIPLEYDTLSACVYAATPGNRSDIMGTQPRNISKSKVEPDLLGFANQGRLCGRLCIWYT